MVIVFSPCPGPPVDPLGAKIILFFRTLTIDWTGLAGLPFLELIRRE
jgi:hypothetical protein